jgi:hypothetical protein
MRCREFARISTCYLLTLSSAAWAAAQNEKPFAFRSNFYAVQLAPTGPALAQLSVDSLGQGKLAPSPLLWERKQPTGQARLQAKGSRKAIYTLPAAGGRPVPAWEFIFEDRALTVRSRYVEGRKVEPLVLTFRQKVNHATLLGLVKPGELKTGLPAVLHLPDMGSFRITCNGPGRKLDYDARRWVPMPFIRIGFPAATKEQPVVEYRWEVAAIYPAIAGIEHDPRYDSFRRNFLNILQVNPRLAMLANNSSSDTCGFCVYEYAEVARRTPPLAKGLTALDLVRMTVDRHLDGVLSYGMTGYVATPECPDLVPENCPYDSLDTYPSLLISAAYYAEGARDWNWAKRRWTGLRRWIDKMLALDADGNGLIEYPISGNSGIWAGMKPNTVRPANWWDTIGYGHEDAYSNAIAYRALTAMAKVAEKLGKKDDAALLSERARRLRAAYYPAFFNEKTGLLAGWKSRDGKLHDYAFMYVQGLAVCYDLVDARQGNAIMDRLLEKMRQVGYDRFEYGLPGNLVPVRQEDYVTKDHHAGGSVSPDGSDGFQIYANGGATGSLAYWTLHALYKLGRKEDARRIFYPMLKSYAAGDFQGFGPNGHSKDLRTWKGECWGYEGLLVDNYLALLAVLDDTAAAP